MLRRLLKIGFFLVLAFFVFKAPAWSQGFPPVDKAKVAEIANRWFGLPLGHPRLDMLDTVISMSEAAGVDPNFTIAIWLHETGASNYAGICQTQGGGDPGAPACQKAQDFGINDQSIETHYTADGTVTEDHFLDQLQAFLNLPSYYAGICGCADMYSFAAMYVSGNSCTPSCSDASYIFGGEGIRTIYGWIGAPVSQFPAYPQPSLAKTCASSPGVAQTCGLASPPPITPTNFTTHPLRPFPDEAKTTDKLTPYCAMRPTPVETQTFDKRNEFINIKTVGTLSQDFTRFITPLLSITDPKKADYLLPYTDKAQRYLADFLEGRAYYEPFVEPTNPTPSQVSDLFNRLGVFRKLAPKTYQDELKRALIQRAAGSFNRNDNPYGFKPASDEVHNYTVGSWQGKKVTLKDFVNNWAPLPKDYPDGGYEDAYETWRNSDGGQWFSLWPYVPMFSREDTTGYIQIIDSSSPPNDPPYSAGTGYIEENKSNPTRVEVSHPHLARTYEVATSLSYLLTPQQNHQADTPQLKEAWIPKLWEDNLWWLDPSYKKPDLNEVDLGPLCDVDPSLISPLNTSGDQAFDSSITTSVNRQDIQVKNPEYQGPPSVQTNCGLLYPCQKCQYRPNQGIYETDDSACFYTRQVRSNPNYLITYTPFLNEILTSLSGSSRAVFDLFKPAGQEKKPYEEYDWPGVGNAGEESPQYNYSPGRAEAGAYKPGDSQSYYYRYLGSLQCAKERVMMVLQPFISGESYKPYAYECFPELTPPTGPTPPSTGQWLQWPCSGAYLQDKVYSVCYKDPRRPIHAGLDLQCPSGAIHPSAPGTVAAVNKDPGASGFGLYVIIDHGNGWSTLYAHLAIGSVSVAVGQKVDLNTTLGRQDNTGAWSLGSHLHLGLSRGNNPHNFEVSGPTADPCAAITGCSCHP